jgi:hypothetical protein
VGESTATRATSIKHRAACPETRHSLCSSIVNAVRKLKIHKSTEQERSSMITAGLVGSVEEGQRHSISNAWMTNFPLPPWKIQRAHEPICPVPSPAFSLAASRPSMAEIQQAKQTQGCLAFGLAFWLAFWLDAPRRLWDFDNVDARVNMAMCRGAVRTHETWDLGESITALQVSKPH